MTTRLLKYFLILTASISLSSAAGYLALFGPRTVQHRDKFKVLLTAVGYEGSDKGKIEVSLRSEDDKESIDKLTIDMGDDGAVDKILEFDLEKSKKVQNYTLKAKTLDGTFEQSTKIFTIAKRYSVLVQTDKPLYNPGDKVNFRVVIFNSEMKLQKLGHFSIHIVNGYGNVFKPFDNLLEEDSEESDDFVNGVFTKNFTLSDEPIMGFWSIKVMTNDKKEEKNNDQNVEQNMVTTTHFFEVKKHPLPTIKVIVVTKKELTHSAKTIDLKISANYTFGQFVAGTAVVSAWTYDASYPEVVQHVSEKKTVEVENMSKVSFRIKEDLKIENSIRPYFAHFDIDFIDKLTGQKASTSVEVRIFKTGKFTIEFSRQEKRFKPGFPYNFTTSVLNFDGSPYSLNNPVQVTVISDFSPPKCSKVNMSELDRTFVLSLEEMMEKGKHDFSVMIPTNTTSLKISAKFFDDEASINVKRQESRTRDYVKINLLNSPQIGKDLKVRFKKVRFVDDGETHQLNVIVTNRMGIAYTSSVKEFSESVDDKMNKMKIRITSEMAPLSYLTVYYIHPHGEIIYDQVMLEIEKPFPLKLSIKLSESEVAPGSKVSITIKAKNDTVVSLLGVDESVTLLGDGNDINKKRLNADLSAYDVFQNLENLIISGNDKRYLDIGTSNSFILTNALDGSSNKCGINAKSGSSDGYINNEDEDNDEDESNESGNDSEEKTTDKKEPRTNFAETWIFENVEMGSRPKITITRKVPDTITSFLISGFAIHPETGFGIAAQQKLTVFQNFFLQLYLPYSIRLGETLKVVVSVYNYNKEEVTVDVTMFNGDGKFKFVTPVGNTCKELKETKMKKAVTISPKTGSSTYFLVRPTSTGQITLKVKASNENDGGELFDEIKKNFKVEHEGITTIKTTSKLFDLREKTIDSFAFNLGIPNDHIPSSLKINARAIADLLGPALPNIHNLIKMPSGCNEQIFKSWIPNIAAIKYLKAIDKLEEEFVKTSSAFLLNGYQEVLKRKQSDGSYSMWGEKGDASTWLTAYVVKVLGHVKNFASINDKHIYDGLDFVKNKQRPEGNFTDPVASYYYISKTKSQTGIGLTAFVVIAVFESGYYEDYKEMIDRSLNYLNSQANKISDNFALAISAYALSLGSLEHLNASRQFVTELDINAIKKDDTMHWYREAKQLKTSESPSINVEIASYAMMAYINVGRGEEALKIMKWLMTQMNDLGGFYSTTDTVIALQALAMIAERFHSKNINVNSKLSYENGRSFLSVFNSDNALLQQSKDIEGDARNFRCVANGTGLAYLQVIASYNTKLLDSSKQFNLSANVQPNKNKNVLQLKICTNFIPDEETNQSQMALIEVELPSGYVYDPETVKLEELAGCRRVESRNQNTLIVLYFDSIGETEVCLEIEATRKAVVTDLKQSVVRIYDYNNQKHRASAFYNPSNHHPCGVDE